MGIFTVGEFVADLFVFWWVVWSFLYNSIVRRISLANVSNFTNSRLPFYYEFKALFVLWLILPQTRGSNYLYRHLIHPLLTRHESKIDASLQNVQEQAKRTSVEFGKKALLAARQAVLTGLAKAPLLLNDAMAIQQGNNSDTVTSNSGKIQEVFDEPLPRPPRVSISPSPSISPSAQLPNISTNSSNTRIMDDLFTSALFSPSSYPEKSRQVDRIRDRKERLKKMLQDLEDQELRSMSATAAAYSTMMDASSHTTTSHQAPSSSTSSWSSGLKSTIVSVATVGASGASKLAGYMNTKITSSETSPSSSSKSGIQPSTAQSTTSKSSIPTYTSPTKRTIDTSTSTSSTTTKPTRTRFGTANSSLSPQSSTPTSASSSSSDLPYLPGDYSRSIGLRHISEDSINDYRTYDHETDDTIPDATRLDWIREEIDDGDDDLGLGNVESDDVMASAVIVDGVVDESSFMKKKSKKRKSKRNSKRRSNAGGVGGSSSESLNTNGSGSGNLSVEDVSGRGLAVGSI